MATRDINQKYPVTIKRDIHTRNGLVPDWRVGHAVSGMLMKSLCHQRKVVFVKSTDPSNAPAEQGTQQVPWRWYFRSGEASTTAGSLRLTAVATVCPASTGSGVTSQDSRWRMVVDDGTPTNSRYRRLFEVVASPTLDDVRTQRVSVNIDPDTAYECHIEIEDKLRMFGLTVYEEHVPFVDTADAIVSDFQRFGFESEITDAQHADTFVTTPHDLWKHNASHLFSYAPETESGFHTTTSATYKNMFDAFASTTVGANTPGFNPQVRYYNPVHTDNVACVFAAYAYLDAGGAATGEVRLAESSGALVTLNVTGTTPQWYTGTFNLDGTVDTHKIDPHFRGDGTAQITVEAISAYVYVS